MLLGDTPKPTLETENSGIPDVQPTNVLLVTAEVHASFDYSPHRKQDTEEKTSQSNNTRIECAKKVDDKLKLSLQNKKDTDNKKKGNLEKVLSNKSSPLTDERQKKLHMVSDHKIEDNNPVNTKLEIKKLNMNKEEDIDSDSTILYDVPETGLGNKTDSIENTTLPKPTLILESKIPTASHVASKTKKITNITHENKAIGLNPKKSGRRVTEKTSRTNKDEKQRVHKTKYQQITNTTTTKKVKTSTRKDLSSESLPKFTYSSYKLSRSKKRKYTFHCPITGCKKSFMSVKKLESTSLEQASSHKISMLDLFKVD